MFQNGCSIYLQLYENLTSLSILEMIRSLNFWPTADMQLYLNIVLINISLFNEAESQMFIGHWNFLFGEVLVQIFCLFSL